MYASHLLGDIIMTQVKAIVPSMITGDATKNKSYKPFVAAMPQSVIDQKRLSDVNDQINQKARSGKQLGATVIAADMTDPENWVLVGLAIAEGSKPADAWKIIAVA